MKTIIKLIWLMMITSSLLSSCKRFLEVDPPKNKITPVQMFENDQVATSAMTGVYQRMSVGSFSGGQASVSMLTGLSSDEFKNHNLEYTNFVNTSVQPIDRYLDAIWASAYQYIYTVNGVIEGLQMSKQVTDVTKKQLEGEAKFTRAFFYFYLVNLFGEVPLNLTTDYRVNEAARQSSVQAIYNQIISDLIEAENLLSETYVSSERIRPNKWVAKSLLARVYLYTSQWGKASKEAGDVIAQPSLYQLVDDLDLVFKKNSSETIWQIMPPAGTNTPEGFMFILEAVPNDVSISPEFLPFFENQDNRRNKWIKEFADGGVTYFYPAKYKVKSSSDVTEYSMVLRLAEMYLIRAEASAQLGNVEQALSNINMIRNRAGFTVPLSGLSSSQCLTEIYNQRRLELFSEWGHRWLDLKRTNLATTVLKPIKGDNWNDTDVLYPIPSTELLMNSNIRQNNGY